MSKKPLEGIRVLDFTNALAGPYCSMMLGNMGAEVIKVEKPGTGDDSRGYGPFVNGQSGYFLSVNHGKKSVVCNTKDPEGVEMFKDLVKHVDIVVENLKAGAMNRMGLGYEELKKVNPKLIYVAISGFGQTGPYAPRPAYDMVVQAMGGVMSITGEPGGKPVRVGASIGDIIAGIFGAFGAVTALYKRAITGEGDMVDVGMLDCQLAILENAIIKYSATGVVAGPLGAVHPTVTPFQAFETKDNYVIAACGNNRLYAAFCNALGCPEMIDDPRFDTNMHRNQNLKLIGDLLTEKTRTKTTAEWLDILEKAGVPCTGINTVDKLFTDPQVAARNMLIEVDQPGMGKVKIAGNPVKMASVDADADHHPAPVLGSSTRDVLVNMLGWDENKADEYVEKFH